MHLARKEKGHLYIHSRYPNLNVSASSMPRVKFAGMGSWAGWRLSDLG